MCAHAHIVPQTFFLLSKRTGLTESGLPASRRNPYLAAEASLALPAAHLPMRAAFSPRRCAGLFYGRDSLGRGSIENHGPPMIQFGKVNFGDGVASALIGAGFGNKPAAPQVQSTISRLW
jgi:hypothetical protein